MSFDIFGKQIEVKKEIAYALVCFLFILSGFIGFLLKPDTKGVVIDKGTGSDKPGVTAPANTKPTDNAQVLPAKTTNKSDDEIQVYVVGCVKKQGLVTIKKGQLIYDALMAAGGATTDADLRNINLAYKLDSNVMLEILPKQKSGSTSSQATKKSPDSDGIQESSGVRIVSDSGGAVKSGLTSGTTVSDTGSGSGKININTASLTELDSLPGIGEKTAQDIISHRETKGPFKNIEQIMDVPRIGDKKFEDIKVLITVG